LNSTTIITIALIVLIVWIVVRGIKGSKGIANYTAEQFGERLQLKSETELVDVREIAEYRGGHIPGSINIPLSQLQGRISEISRDREVLLYCRSGMRSKRAAAILRGQGFQYLGHLQGGILSWKGPIKK